MMLSPASRQAARCCELCALAARFTRVFVVSASLPYCWRQQFHHRYRFEITRRSTKPFAIRVLLETSTRIIGRRFEGSEVEPALAVSAIRKFIDSGVSNPRPAAR
ncbi:hypothetical protein KCP76_22395 [Salmonella enterica subsp. enterica serovar Weltevreden]|nr:hypothetical protein KCP76_22395 [Salmonella enterica subsp. enterica serovar Weltevreden]